MGCDVDDILCNSMALAHLKGLRDTLGEDRFREEFPELKGLDEKIAVREADLRTSLEGCREKAAEPEPLPEEIKAEER